MRNTQSSKTKPKPVYNSLSLKDSTTTLLSLSPAGKIARNIEKIVLLSNRKHILIEHDDWNGLLALAQEWDDMGCQNTAGQIRLQAESIKRKTGR